MPLRYESANCLASNGVFPFSEPVLVTYIDLDRLIGMAGLSGAEHKIVGYIMDGYSIPDIAQRYGKDRKVIHRVLDDAVAKICKADRRCWEDAHLSQK